MKIFAYLCPNQLTTAKAMTAKNHMPWVDYAKCFSILLVISFHCPGWGGGYLGDLLQLLRMPAFFLISGFLFRENKYKSLRAFIKHRSIQLLVPYVCFFVLFYAFWLCFGRDMVGGEELTIPRWRPMLEFVSGTPYVVVATYWFIACLFSMQIIYYLLARFVPAGWRIPLVCLAPFLASVPGIDLLPWNIPNALLYLPYYAFANMGKDIIMKINLKHFGRVFLLFALCLAGIAYLNIIPHWLIAPYKTLLGLLVLPMYIIAVKSIPEGSAINRAASFIGKNTIIYLAIQNYIIGLVKIFAAPLIASVTSSGNYNPGWTLINLSTMVIVVLVGVPVVIVINKWMPWMVGRGEYFKNKLKQYT